MDDEEDHRYEFVYLDRLEALHEELLYSLVITKVEYNKVHSKSTLKYKMTVKSRT